MERLFDEDLPSEAREIADQANLLIQGIQEDARREIAEIQERLEAEIAVANVEADRKARDCVGRAVSKLKVMQESYFREFKGRFKTEVQQLRAPIRE
jgi:membrane protein involved in colicin uptake